MKRNKGNPGMHFQAAQTLLTRLWKVCMFCHRVQDINGVWVDCEAPKGSKKTHGLCEPCLEKHYPEKGV